MVAILRDRAATRQKIFEPFLFVDQSGERRAHLLDISETGGLVHCDHGFAEGDVVELRIHGRSLDGAVAWTARPRLGVTFFKPIPAGIVREIMQPA